MGSFKPLLSAVQAMAVQDLMHEINHQEVLPDDRVLAFMHTFLLDIFAHTYSITQEVSSILEQVIIIHCLTEDVDQPWRSTTWMYSIISIHFRLAKELVVHAAVLGGRKARYEQLPPVPSSPEFANVAEEPTDMEDAMLSLLNEEFDQEPEMDEGAGKPEEGEIMEPFNLVLK